MEPVLATLNVYVPGPDSVTELGVSLYSLSETLIVLLDPDEDALPEVEPAWICELLPPPQPAVARPTATTTVPRKGVFGFITGKYAPSRRPVFFRSCRCRRHTRRFVHQVEHAHAV